MSADEIKVYATAALFIGLGVVALTLLVAAVIFGVQKAFDAGWFNAPLVAIAEFPKLDRPGEDPKPKPVSGRNLPAAGVHFATLTAAVAVSVFLFNNVGTSLDRLDANLARFDSKLAAIPGKDDVKSAVDRVEDRVRFMDEKVASTVELAIKDQREELTKQTNELRLLNEQMKSQQALLGQKVAMMDDRIREIGIDRSAELAKYFLEIQNAKAKPTGGAEGNEDLLSDYAVRLLVREEQMSVRSARAYVTKAFLTPRGNEAKHLMELADTARARGRGATD